MDAQPNPSTPSPTRARVPVRVRAALIVLGITGLLQVAALAWSYAARIRIQDRAPHGAVDAPASTPSAEAEEVDLGAIEAMILSERLGAWEGAGADGASGIGALPSPLVEDSVRYDASGIIDPEAAALVAQGIRLRESGDTLGALDHFRTAINRLPEHPRILYELATTCDLMGLTARGAESWEKLFLLGDIAGEFHRIADFKLRGGDDQAPVTASHQPLLIADVRLDRETGPDSPEGERLRLRIALRARAETFIDHSKVETHVYFFDLVNGRSIDQSTALPPVAQWVTGPAVDWQESGEEILEVTYHQPPLSEDELRNLGSRIYYGHLIKLYYDNQLVDQIAEPRTLFDRQLPAADREPWLDGSLFPDQ